MTSEYLIAIREWLNFIFEGAILYVLVIEYYFDKEVEDKKQQKKARSTKKTTTQPSGVSIIEETIDYEKTNEEKTPKP